MVFVIKNEHINSVENPCKHRPLRNQVWAQLKGDGIIGPFIFENNLNGESYVYLLE